MRGYSRTIAIVGATATGKTALGIEVAKRLNGEIISADAVAVYRGLTIGTAKPTSDEQNDARFHLIDVAEPNEDFTVADFERLGSAAIEEIVERGKLPIIVGGTGLYVRALTAELAIPTVPPQIELREKLWAEAEAHGSEKLHEKLATIDKVSASKILIGDAKRIIRALEVYEVTGKPLSSFHTPDGVHGKPLPGVTIFGIAMDRELLYRRIEARVDAMLVQGLLDEVRDLLMAGNLPTYKSMLSLGYRHMAMYLRGEWDWTTTVELLKRDTRRFARRQLMWFRADKNVRWIEADGRMDAALLAERFLSDL